MEPVPLIPKPQFLPNIDTAPLLRELFQDEFQTAVPSEKVSQNIVASFQKKASNEEKTSIYITDNLAKRKDRLKDYAENVLEAYKNYQKNLCDIRNAEKHLSETHVNYLKREVTILEDRRVQDLLSLKRYPLFQALGENYVEKYKLLQGDAGLPPKFAATSDFRVMNFKKWRKNLDNFSSASLFDTCKKNDSFVENGNKKALQKSTPEPCEKPRKPRPKKEKISTKRVEIFKATPKIVFFNNFKVGEIYRMDIQVKNIYCKATRFTVKAMNPDGPFQVLLKEKPKEKLPAGLTFVITVEFKPKSLDDAAEDVILLAEDGNRLLIPVVAFLEPPLLKTHDDLDEFTKVTAERISCSYIECGECFTGDSKVTKVRFRSFGDSGEFFIMSSDNWTRNYINSVTTDNMLEIPPFRVYPVFFKIKKGEVIDLLIEFLPETSGTHVEKIMITCNNGEMASLDLLADAMGWHSYFFTFQESLLKDLSVNQDDDPKVKYYLNFEDVLPNGNAKKVFYVSNNSNMSFEYQWKIREANICSNGGEYFRIPRNQVKIDPESGTFEGNKVLEFLVTINLNNVDLGAYRMVLSLYVLNLPYQCIEEDNTIIQPTGLVRNLYSQSLYGEEECTPELLSLQGTYETLRESIKSYVECQNKNQSALKNDVCKTVCSLNPGLCAKPLKKSKTFFNIGENIDDENMTCVCRPRPAETESLSESCHSRDKSQEDTPPQKNEVTWDFVDVLVDEIELWVEVVPPRLSVEPCVVELPSNLQVGGPPIVKNLVITNHNRSAVTCFWLLAGKNSEQNKIKENQRLSEEAKIIFSNSKVKSLESEYDATEFEETKEILEPYQIALDPEYDFTIHPLSEITCTITISVHKIGKIEDSIFLSDINEYLEIKIPILGHAVSKNFEISSDILDFGALRQNGRFSQDFKIINKTPGPLLWQINQFELECPKESLFRFKEIKNSNNMKTDSGVIECEEEVALQTYQFDARKLGINCFILEVEGHKVESLNAAKEYILTLGNVTQPNLSVYAARFENAILAIPGKIYVNQKVSKNVILTNTGPVETFFVWGNLFGCHCRKIKVQMFPKKGEIRKGEKLMIRVDVTGLDEGIISHCYIPCFFCRSKYPLILSVVAIIEKLNVTFEIIDYPNQTHADVSTFLKSPFYHTVLRIPWPMKTYNPTLNLSHVPEEVVTDMLCMCAEAEAEANRAFGDPRQGEETQETAKRSLSTNRSSNEQINKIKVSSRRTIKSLSDEDFKTSCSSDEKKISEENCLLVYSSRASTNDFVQCLKPQLDFSDTPYRTPVLRQFAIRNETPVPTKFRIRARYYGMSKNLPPKRIVDIKKKVFGFNNDNYHDKLLKNQPLVLIIEPSEGDLDAFEAVCISVTAYGNTWGEYSDSLLCEIKGIETFDLKLFVRIVGHPVHFPGIVSQLSSKPILRFQPINCVSQTMSTQIKVVNRSAVPLTIAWIVFLIEPLPEEEREESFNSCVQSFANIESNQSGGNSTKSSKNYIPKNTSDSGLPFRNMLEARGQSKVTLRTVVKDLICWAKGERVEISGVKMEHPAKKIKNGDPAGSWKAQTLLGASFRSTYNEDPGRFGVTFDETQTDCAVDGSRLFERKRSPSQLPGRSRPVSGCERNSVNRLPSKVRAITAKYFSDSGTLESFAKTDSFLEKREKSEFSGEEKSLSVPTLSEEEKSQVQRLSFPGRLDNYTFQVNPKEIFFEPFEEKKMTITFNPGVHITKNYSQEYKGVLTGCVKLKPEDERCPGIYYRPCGVNFVSELMDFNALVETSLVSFELLKGDLKFIMDANAILQSPEKKQIQRRKFLIKNNTQSVVSLKIEMMSGVIFGINSVEAPGKHYPEYNPRTHLLKIESGQLIEVELLCTVSYEDVMRAYAQLLQKKNKCRRSLMSGNIGDSDGREKEKNKIGKEPWRQFFNTVSLEKLQNQKCHTEPKDSLEINLNRLSFKSDNSVCFDSPRDFEEYEGEEYVLWDDEIPAEEKLQHISILEDKINFVQPGLVTQTLTTELHLSFPAIKLSSNSFDFGNVYIGESAVRYFTLINLTGFPTDFRIKAKSNNGDFSLCPITGNLPPTNYNLDIGVTITIEFRPSEPCFSKETFQVYCNLDFEFDFYEFYVAGFGSWNEKYKRPRFETHTKSKQIGQT